MCLEIMRTSPMFVCLCLICPARLTLDEWIPLEHRTSTTTTTTTTTTLSVYLSDPCLSVFVRVCVCVLRNQVALVGSLEVDNNKS